MTRSDGNGLLGGNQVGPICGGICLTTQLRLQKRKEKKNEHNLITKWNLKEIDITGKMGKEEYTHACM